MNNMSGTQVESMSNAQAESESGTQVESVSNAPAESTSSVQAENVSSAPASDVSDARLARLRQVCASEGLSALYVRDTSNIRWATVFDNVFDDEAAHAMYVDATRAVLHTDSRYAQACELAAAQTSITVDVTRESHASFAARMWQTSMQEKNCDGEALRSERTCEGEVSRIARACDGESEGEEAADTCDAGAAQSQQALGIENGISLAEYRALEQAFANTAETAHNNEPTNVNSVSRETLQAPLASHETAPSTNVAPSASSTTAQLNTFSVLPFAETTDLVVGVRAVKDAGEIARLKAAQAITDAAFSHIITFMRPGMTEREVQIELEDFMRRHGAEDLAFSSIVATGANGASPHAIPGQTRLEAGQCVVMDFGARAQGYCSDMTRMVFLGEPSAHLRDAYAALRQANEQVEAMLRPGVTGKQAHELAEEVLAQAGFGGKMGHGLGHGVGIDIHEEPVLSPRNDKPLVEGNVVTVEPGIYIPGEFGMRLEDFGVITERGFEVFTQSTHEMVVL